MPLCFGVAHGGGHAEVGHRHDHVGRDAGLPREFGADALARVVDRHALHHRVGAGEVDVFEDAEPLLAWRPNGLMLCTPWSLMTTISPGSTSRMKSAPTISRAQVSLASTQPPVPSDADAAQDQRADAQRIAHAHQGFVGQRDQGIGADHLLQRVDQPVHHGGIQADGDQVDEDLAVGGGLEQAAAADQGAMQRVGVGQVAVMRDREAAELEIGIQRLDIAQDRVAGGGVAVVADRRCGRAACRSPGRRRNCRRPGPCRGGSGSGRRRSWRCRWLPGRGAAGHAGPAR